MFEDIFNLKCKKVMKGERFYESTGDQAITKKRFKMARQNAYHADKTASSSVTIPLAGRVQPYPA